MLLLPILFLLADDTESLQAMFDAACAAHNKVQLAAGVYNISAPIVTKCALSITGQGADRSIIVQTGQRNLNHAIIASFPLTLQDLAVRTEPLHKDLGMAAVYRNDETGPALGQEFSFVRFHSSGFNFAIDIAGTSDADMLGLVVVRDCNLSVSTVPAAVANPVNVRDAASLTVENNVLTGDGNNDHAIYLIGVRKILIRNNMIENHGDSAIKLLTKGFHAPACPTRHDDYSSWTIVNNTIDHAKLALAAYTYCDIHLTSLVIADNRISNIPDTYESDSAATYIQATCRSVMENVSMHGNVFRNIGLSGVILLSTTQGGPPCADVASHGTIALFTSIGDKFINFSTSYPGKYFAISANGPKVLRANISQITADGQTHGRAALNLGSVVRATSSNITEINLANRGATLTEAMLTRLLLSLHF